VPHLVTLVDNVDTFDKEEARELRNRYNANVNYASAKDGVIRVRTYERGVEDETLACGTGMAAAFLRASLEGFVAESAVVIPAGGERLNLSKKGERLTLKGEVRRIFDAKLEREFD
ncbi:MAG: diaminopimelate epimerase, partial [Hydrogenimonas sp.]|nr:diaminopimelate epimerase [Hydrogenimonas sp.]